MKLECAESISSPAATETDVKKAFADDAGRGEYIILSESEGVFLQAAGEDEGPFTLEYRDGSSDRHFQCTRDIKKPEVEALFLKYLMRDSSWKTDVEWKILEKKPWWKVW